MPTKLFWGDLHNHCAISYGASTLTRALNNARTHLDFCTITGHAFWPDMPMDLKTQDPIIGMHLGGFEKLRHFWADALKEMKRASKPGKFVVFPSYEWHSMRYGDYNCYFPTFDPPLLGAETLPRLAATLRKQQRPFFMLPHHCGYAPGYRGTDWKSFDESTSPLAEIYSNHGCCESDDAPYDYYHSMGPRAGISTIRQGLVLGKKFGFYASTDSHDGYPGHYGHGITGVMASRLTSESIWEALRERRTIASTGARMHIDFNLGPASTGGKFSAVGKSALLRVAAEATAPIVRAEIVTGNKKGWRVTPIPLPGSESAFRPGRFKIKLEAGWGRGSQVSKWDLSIQVSGGTLASHTPCFRHSVHPLAEDEATESIQKVSGNSLRWRCHATPNPAGLMGGTHFNASGTQAILLEVEGGKSTKIELRSSTGSLQVSLSDLTMGSVVEPSGSFGSSALKIHRASPESEWNFEHEQQLALNADAGFCYTRIFQSDGHVAWASPIWWE